MRDACGNSFTPTAWVCKTQYLRQERQLNPGDEHGRNRTDFDLKLQKLPPQRLAEVKDFVEFLAAREERAAAGARLGESLARPDVLNLPPLSDEDIAAEIQAAREDRPARRA